MKSTALSTPARYYHPLCAKLATVTSDNVEEQILTRLSTPHANTPLPHTVVLQVK